MAGRQNDPGASVGHFFVARYHANGHLDTTFGTNGVAVATADVLDVVSRPYDQVGMALQTDGRVVVATTTAATNHDFILARFLLSGPQIGSFTASPDPVAAGDPLTLTAGGVSALNPGSTVAQVAFYADTNGDGVLEAGPDQFLGYAAQTSPGVWTLTFTVNLAPGTYTLFAAPTDSYGVLGDPLPVGLSVI